MVEVIAANELQSRVEKQAFQVAGKFGHPC